MNYKNTHPYYRELVVENYKDGILKLIEPDLKYAELSLGWVSTPEIVQYMGADFSNPSLEGEKKRIQDILENKDEYHWMIQLDGKVIGNVNINSIAEISKKFGVKAASPAILIGDKQYWHKGIGYHAMKAVLSWAFGEAGFEVIAARVLQENIASTKNLEKLGFEADGIEPYEGLVNGNMSMWKKYKLTKNNLKFFQNKEFEFLDPGKLIDDELELILAEKIPADEEKGYFPVYKFEMRNSKTAEKIGGIHLRIGHNENIFYGGNIGYGVDEKFRGKHYATRSVKLVLNLAKQHGLNQLLITCNPENIASRRTCELAGGKLMAIVDLPQYNDQYKLGERKKCIYRFEL